MGTIGNSLLDVLVRELLQSASNLKLQLGEKELEKSLERQKGIFYRLG